MKAGDLVKLKRSHTFSPGVVIKVKPLSTGDWALVVWPDEMSTWNNFRDLEVISG